MEEEIDLIELLHVLLKRKWIVIASTFLVAAFAFGYTYFLVTPVYDAKTTLMVNGSKGSDLGDIAASFDISSINMSQKLVVTYSEIVKSRIVLEQVINRLDLPLSYNQLSDLVVSMPVKTTEILNITVTNGDPDEAALIANTIADVFIKEVIRILKVNNVEIIDKAIPIYQDVNVHLSRNVAIGGILGMMLGCGIVLLMFMMDRTLKTADDIVKHLELPVLGTIVEFDYDKVSKG